MNNTSCFCYWIVRMKDCTGKSNAMYACCHDGRNIVISDTSYSNNRKMNIIFIHLANYVSITIQA